MSQEKRLITVSKTLSLVLRHQPQSIGIALDENGWIPVDTLLTALNKRGHKVSLEELQEVVQSNDKQRFRFSEDGLKIRANQGHSVSVDLELVPVEPPLYLYHGTATRFLAGIQEAGLIKQSRQHVHLAADKETARKVGSRHGLPTILTIRSGDMYQNGFIFYQSDNGVWLTNTVPVTYIQFPN